MKTDLPREILLLGEPYEVAADRKSGSITLVRRFGAEWTLTFVLAFGRWNLWEIRESGRTGIPAGVLAAAHKWLEKNAADKVDATLFGGTHG